MRKRQYQQGDVWIEAQAIPAQAALTPVAPLAEGEVTGHSHRVVAGDVEMLALEGMRYLRVLSDKAVISHEEHGPITLPRGEYVFGQVQEWDYDAEESRHVRD